VTTEWFHRACIHSATDIEADGLVIRPHYQQMLGTRLSWFTFDRGASALALGLAGRVIISCDRMERLFQVVEEDRHLVVPWSGVSRQFQMGHYLEATKGTRPGVWGVAFEEVRVVPHE
jgi:hypothetical protein